MSEKNISKINGYLIKDGYAREEIEKIKENGDSYAREEIEKIKENGVGGGDGSVSTRALYSHCVTFNTTGTNPPNIVVINFISYRKEVFNSVDDFVDWYKTSNITELHVSGHVCKSSSTSGTPTYSLTVASVVSLTMNETHIIFNGKKIDTENEPIVGMYLGVNSLSIGKSSVSSIV